MKNIQIRKVKGQYYLYLVKTIKDIKYYGKYDRDNINKDIVFDRDDKRCRICGTKENLDIGYIIPINLGGSISDFDNIISVCNECKLDDKDIDLCEQLKFIIRVYESDYKKKHKDIDEKLMKKSVMRRKNVQEMVKKINIRLL